MKKVIVISGHPSVNEESICNKIILEKLQGLEYVQVRNLQSMYPDFKIDVEAEQAALKEADMIVFQFPFYWYSVPGILKVWLDQVFTYGFAYGSTGDKLHGKELLISTTIGGPEESYRTGGYNTYPVEDLLMPLKQTANLAGMKRLTPVVSHGMTYIPNVYNIKEEVEERARQHAERLIAAFSSFPSNEGLEREAN